MLCYKREANLQTEDLLVSQQNLLACHLRPATTGRSQDLATGRTGKVQGQTTKLSSSLRIRLHSH